MSEFSADEALTLIGDIERRRQARKRPIRQKVLMKFIPRHPKSTPLTDREKAALQRISGGEIVETEACEHLQDLGLIEKRHGGWAITYQGSVHLMFLSAR
jgi:hypothetical protein